MVPGGKLAFHVSQIMLCVHRERHLSIRYTISYYTIVADKAYMILSSACKMFEKFLMTCKVSKQSVRRKYDYDI